MSMLEHDWNRTIKKSMWFGLPAAAVFGIYSAISSSHVAGKHEERVAHAFHNAVFADNTNGRNVAIEVDGVKREGHIHAGRAIPTYDSRLKPTSLMSLNDARSMCWYATLAVQDGADNAPGWEKTWGADLEVITYADDAFKDYACLPVPPQEIDTTPLSAPQPKP